MKSLLQIVDAAAIYLRCYANPTKMRLSYMADIGIASDYITRKQLAEELGKRMRGKPFSVHTLKYWQAQKMGPPVTKVGREPVYRVDSVEKWLREQEVRS